MYKLSTHQGPRSNPGAGSSSLSVWTRYEVGKVSNRSSGLAVLVLLHVKMMIASIFCTLDDTVAIQTLKRN